MHEVTDIYDRVIITLYERAVKVGEDDDGLPIYEGKTYIKKQPPNQRDCYDQPVKDSDRVKYKDLFQKYEAQEEVILEGLPISEWNGIDVATAAELKDMGFLTVQQFADSEVSGRLLPIHKKAKEYMSSSSRIRELEAQVATLKKNQKKTPGRKPKAA